MAYRIVDEFEHVKPEEGYLAQAGRHLGRTAARAGEAILGLPGDIAGAFRNLSGAAEKVANEHGFPFPQVARDINKSQQILPTSENVKEQVTKRVERGLGQEGYLEPRSPGEQTWDHIIKDAAVIWNPAKGIGPLFKSIGAAVGKSAAGNIAGKLAENFTDSPFIGAATKVGTMALAGTVGGRRELNELKIKSYEEAFSKLPENTPINIRPARSKIEEMIKIASKGDRPDKGFILDRLNAIKNAKTVQQAVQLKQDWNKYLGNPTLSKTSRNTLERAVRAVNNDIASYGKKNPGFFKPYMTGEELTAGLQGTNYFQKLLDAHPGLKKYAKNSLAKHLFYIGAIGGLKAASLPQLAGGVAVVGGIREAARAYKLLTTSPTAFNHYTKAIQSAFKGNLGATAREMTALSHAADRFDKSAPSKGKYRIVD